MGQVSRLPEFRAPAGGRLSDEMRAAFDREGVIVLRGFATSEACEALRARTLDLVGAFDPMTVRSVFSAASQVMHKDDYFLESGDKIRFFLEEEAFDERGALRQAKADSLNKMGHAMHDLDPVFDVFSRTPALGEAVRRLGFADPLLLQSMYIFKPPGIGGEVTNHQDSTYLYTEPESCIGFWFAIDDADLDNGCMQFIPGGHKAPLRKRARNISGRGLVIETLDDTLFTNDQAAPAVAKTGDLVIFHGRTPHMSGPNRSARSRHAYTLHVIDGKAEYPADNWLQRPSHTPLRGFDAVG